MTDTLEHRRARPTSSTPRSPPARWPRSGTASSPTEAGQPEQQAQVQGARGRHRPGRGDGRGDAGRARLPGRGVHVPRLARRAHSIAAQGGINAAKNYRGDGDSVYRLFYDTIKGGDFRAREANVYRLAQVSVNIIDQVVAQGVPFAREYGGLLDNRSFGGAQVSRTFYARGQTGQQLLLGAYQQCPARSAWQRQAVDPHGAGRHRRHRRPLRRHRHPRPAHRRGPLARRPRRGARHRRLRQRLLPVDQRHELQRHGGVAGSPPRRASPTRATRRSTRRASRSPTTCSRSSR